MAGENLDLSSGDDRSPNSGAARTRYFVGIRFACCAVYSRIYINRALTAYVGRCPRCLKKVELKIAPQGTDERFFTAY